jgi:hypothetical protein
MPGEKLGPIEIEFLLDKKADEEAKKLKGSLDAVSSSGTRGSKQLTAAIKEQKDIIKEVEAAVKKLQKAYEDAAPGKNKQAAWNELRGATKALAEEKGTLIGLQNEQIEVNKREEVSASSLSGVIGKWALTLGGATAALGILKKAFGETVGGMDAMSDAGVYLKQMLHDIITLSGGVSQKAGEALLIQQAMNDLKRQGYIESIKAAKADAEYQELYSESLDANLSNADRIKKIDEALAAHHKEIAIEKAETIKQLNLIIKSRDLQPDNDELIKQETDLIKKLQDLRREDVESTKRLVRTRSVLVKEEIDKELKWRQDLHDKLQKLADEEIQKNTDEDNKLKELQNEIALNKVEGLEKEKLAIKQKYDLDIERYKNNAAIKTALTIKYQQDIYLVEKKFLDKLKEDNLKAIDEIIKATPDRGYTLLDKALIGAGKTPSDYGAINSGGSANKIHHTKISTNSQAQDDKQAEKDREDSLKKQAELHKQIANSAADLVMRLAQQVGLSDEESQLLGGMVDSIANLASGNLVGAVTSFLSGLMAMIPNEAEKFALQVEHINNLIKEEQRLIDQSERKGGYSTAVKGKMDDLKQLKELNDQAVKIAEINLKDKQGFMFGIGIGVNKAKKQLEEAKQAAIETQNAIDDLQQEYDDFIRGGITENTITDSIAQGFEDAKSSVDDFGNYINTILLDAITNVFKAKLLDDPALKALMAEITAAFDDQNLTNEEKAKIKKDYSDLAALWQSWWKDNTAGLIDNNSASSLIGAIKGETEETASVVAGQMNAIRIGQAAATSIMRQQLLSLNEIAINTRYNVHLESIDKKLDALSSDPLRSKGMV